MELTFEKFKKYLNEIEENLALHRTYFNCKTPNLANSMVELLSGVTNDECGFIHHWVYTLNFGKCSAIQMMFGKNGEAVAIETVEDLWRLLNSEETSMNIKEVQQDLFTVPQGYYLAHCISGDYKPTYDTLYQTLEDMREQCEQFNITKLAMPRIAAGLDRLDWEKVKDVIEDVFGDTDIEILICVL